MFSSQVKKKDLSHKTTIHTPPKIIDLNHNGISDAIEAENEYFLSNSFIRMSSVFALVLIIFSNFTDGLFNGTITHLLAKHCVKHIIAILVLYFFVMVVDSSYTTYSYAKQFLYLLGLYIVFSLFTRCEGKIAFLCLFILFGLYSIHSWLNHLYVQDKQLTKANDFYILRTIEKTLGFLFLGVLFIGVMVYLGFIKHKLGKKLNFYVFFMDNMKTFKSVPFEHMLNYFVLGLKTSIGQ